MCVWFVFVLVREMLMKNITIRARFLLAACAAAAAAVRAAFAARRKAEAEAAAAAAPAKAVTRASRRANSERASINLFISVGRSKDLRSSITSVVRWPPLLLLLLPAQQQRPAAAWKWPAAAAKGRQLLCLSAATRNWM